MSNTPRGPEFIGADSEDLSVGFSPKPIPWEQFTAELLASMSPRSARPRPGARWSTTSSWPPPPACGRPRT